MKTIFAAATALVLGANVGWAERAQAASVVTDITIEVDNTAVDPDLATILLDLLGLSLGAEATGSAFLEPGSTGVIGEPDNREGFIGAEASFALAGTSGTAVISAFEREYYDQVEDFPVGNITDGGATLSPEGSSSSSDVSFVIAGGVIDDAVDFFSGQVYVEFLLLDGMPEGQASLAILLDALDPDILGPTFANASGTALITIDFAPVPLPAGIALFVTGIGVAAGVRHRRQS